MKGLFAVGLFLNADPHTGFNLGVVGLFNGGGFYSLGIQCLAIICIIAWTASTTYFVIGVSDLDLLTLIIDPRLLPYNTGSAMIGLESHNVMSDENQSETRHKKFFHVILP